jgi:ribonuclease E
MVINFVPGEECRVAVIEDGKLQELHAERMDAVSHVGNIYLGRVTNVEASIQAAFVDFGLADNGFLHVTDLHPRYFPGESDDTTERVGKKTPRRDRPPIQQCLKKGQEIAVQVIKEGVGTKGPTLTGYLSIPGRFLVMMPQMDRIGVSRKVEDDDTRRKARKILDQLDLPEGFGFILRTAGMERPKAEIKRDLAYLRRLWKDMECRWNKGKAPKLLYSESDLLVRALRDLLTSDIERVVIDNEQALARASRFMKIVAPRSQTQLCHHADRTPIFHAFGIEQQIQLINAREVMLPSGGRLVFDQTEALVAIDVNSGKSKGAKDAETTAFRTNREAADEICRQLRLRDLGGLVINDLIDMRDSKNRRAIEARFRERLKRDRARTTILPIGEFGILEMTRQRMRSSHESVHFHECPTCHGRGLVQRPESIAADALRGLSALLEHPKVHKVELVVSPRVAGELLSFRRRWLTRIEISSGKQVNVRVSETLPPDRTAFYAYDKSGADLAIDKLDTPKPKSLKAWEDHGAVEDWAEDTASAEAIEPTTIDDLIELEEAAEAMHEEEPVEEAPRKKRRRRRRRRKAATDQTETAQTEETAEKQPDADEQAASETPATAGDAGADQTEGDGDESGRGGEESPQPKKKRSRRRSRSRKKAEPEAVPEAETSPEPQPVEAAAGDEALSTEEGAATTDGEEPQPKKKRRRRRSKAKTTDDATAAESADATEPTKQTDAKQDASDEPAPRSRRRRRRPARSDEDKQPTTEPKPQEAEVKPVRRLYATRRRIKPGQHPPADDRA